MKKDGAVEEKMIENGRDLSCAVVLPAEDNLYLASGVCVE